MIRVVTDSAANLPPSVAREYNVQIVPLIVNIGGTGYREGIELGTEQFYNLLPQASPVPTTSQPSPADFEAVFSRVLAAGDEVVAVTLSSELSGTYNSAVQAAVALGEHAPITIVDSRSVSAGEALMVAAAARAAKAGHSRAEITEMLGPMVDETLLIFTLETLEYLKRGGRIGGARAFLGSILRVQPVILIKDGRVEAGDRARNRRRAIERLVEMPRDRFGTQPVWAGVADAVAESDRDVLLRELQRNLNIEYLLQCEVGPVLGAHAGPGALGVAAVPAPKI
ncbi:MAG: DegV family protein [Ardenticatenaceae bacterium]|nr:DegV family protein [Ardenticatenaceae bacterium]